MPAELWNTRPTPELPEGYTDSGSRLRYKGELLAEYDAQFPGEDLVLFGGYEQGEACVSIEHLPALAIWLQRRSK